MESKFRVVVCGSRYFNDLKFIYEKLDFYLSNQIKNVEIVQGDFDGPDRISQMYAHDRELLLTTFHAEWGKYGKRAGPIRNEEMARYSIACIAFWDGKSRGTLSMINFAKQYNLKLKIIKV